MAKGSLRQQTRVKQAGVKKGQFSILYIVAGAVVLTVTTFLVLYFRGEEKTKVPPASPGALPAGQQADRTAGGAPGSGSPVMSSAFIVPDNPTAQTRLELKHSAGGREAGPSSLRFRWMVNGSSIQDGPASTLEPGSFRKGDTVQVEVVPHDPSSSAQPFLTQTVTIGNLPPSVSDVSLSPEQAFIGSIITASPMGSDPDGDAITYAYQWRVNGKAVGGQVAENTFDTSGLRKRDAVSVSVTGSDGAASAGPVVSGMVTLGNQPPRITSVPPSGLQNGVLSYQVTASDPDGDPASFSLLRAPQGATMDPKTGQFRWDLPKGVMFTGKQEISVRVAVDDGDGGSDTQEFSLTLQDALVY